MDGMVLKAFVVVIVNFFETVNVQKTFWFAIDVKIDVVGNPELKVSFLLIAQCILIWKSNFESFHE